MNVIPLKFDCQQEHTIQRAASPETARSLEGTEPSADANRHPMLAVFDMIRRSAMVAGGK